MRYRQHPPCDRLRPFVRCYWMLEGEFAASPPEQRVFPDGSIEIVFHLADPFESADGKRQSAALAAGQIREPLVLRPGRRAETVGVRFRPAGAAPFLRFPLHEIGGRIVGLEDVWGGRAPRLRDALGEARDRVAVLERFLLECRPEPVAPFGELSTRQYRRRFEAVVGLPPKLYGRIRRFQRALAVLGTVPCAQAAVDCGYCDQSHLVREFREFAGMPPSAWLRGRSDVLFVQDARVVEGLS